MLQEYYTRPSFLPEDSTDGSRDWIFIGTPGWGAPSHIDNVKYPSWQAQVMVLSLLSEHIPVNSKIMQIECPTYEQNILK